MPLMNGYSTGRPKRCAKAHELRRREILAAEEDHHVIEPRSPQRRVIVSSDSSRAEVHAVNLGPDGAGQRDAPRTLDRSRSSGNYGPVFNREGSKHEREGGAGEAGAESTAKADARNVFDYGLPRCWACGLEVSAEQVTAELPVKREHFNRGGRVGGGVLMAMADAMGAAGSVVIARRYRGGTLESNTNFFSAAGDRCCAESVCRSTSDARRPSGRPRSRMPMAAWSRWWCRHKSHCPQRAIEADILRMQVFL